MTSRDWRKCLWLVTQMFAIGWSLTLNDGFFADRLTKTLPDVSVGRVNCNVTLTNYSGSILISSPGDCSSYASCDWIINAQSNPGNDYTGVMVAFSSANLYWADCVHVFSTNTTDISSTTSYKSYCGFQSSGTTNIDGLYWQQLYVAFRACGDWSYPGFRLHYTSDTACLRPRALSLSSTSFSSPFYPETYTRYLECVWYIDVPLNQMMMLSFDYFNVGGSSADACDGTYGRLNITGDRVADLIYCNRNPPPSYLYLLGYGRYVFRLETGTLIPSPGHGFNASYQILDQSSTTPSAGLTLTPASSLANERKWNTMDQKLSTRTVGGLNHYYVPLDKSTVSGLKINEERRRELSSMCNGEIPIELSNDTGIVTSPDYPSNYPGSIDCSWRILPHQSNTGGNYTGVFLAFNDFNLHWSDCVHVSTYSSSAPTTTSAFCGNFRSMPITTYVSSDAYVSFKSCSGTSYPGFRLYYTSDRACWSDQQLPLPIGTIKSPFYPNAPVQQLACRWVMTIPTRQMMILTFDEFNLAGPGTGACNSNYGSITITAGNRAATTYCSSNLPTSDLYLTGSMTFYYQAGSMIPPSTEKYLVSYRVDLENTILCGSGVRLAGSGASYQGRLEVLYNGQWGTVCDAGFTDTQAAVACNSLGFGYVGSFIGNQYGPGTGPIWLSNVQCTGSETCLGRCTHSNWGNSNCTHNNDVSISCQQSVCSAWGDPHYTTFDSLKMDYQGTCRYLLAASVLDVSQHYFEVYSKSFSCSGSAPVSCARYVEVLYDNDIVRLTMTGSGSQVAATVNGVRVQVPYTSVNRVYTIRYSGSYLRYETTFGLRVEYAYITFYIYIPSAYVMRGLCGNNDGNANNDLTLNNGTYVGGQPGAPNMVGDSYISYDPEDPYGECLTGPPPPPPCTPTPPSYISRCGMLKDTSGPFRDCIAAMGIDAANTVYDDCILDACYSSGASICDSLQVFVEHCAHYDVVISCDQWQASAGCAEVSCPTGMVYRCNTTACLATCTNPYAPDDCLEPNRAACVCPDGKILHQGVCVSTCPIGCIDDTDSQFHPIGDQWPAKNNCSTLTCSYCPDCPLSGRIDWTDGCRPFELCSGNVCVVPTTATTPPTTSTIPTTQPGDGYPILNNRPYVAVQLNGSLALGSALTSDCQEGYNGEFSDSFSYVVGRINTLIGQGLLCSSGLVVMAGPSLLTEQDNQGRVSMTLMVGVSPPNYVTLGDVETCSSQTSVFVQNFQNWRQPIIPAIFGCPPSNFNPTTFDYKQSTWKTLY